MRSGNPRALRFPRARVRDVDVRCPRLRRRVAADFAERLGGQTIIAARRGAARCGAKYLLLDLSGGGSWIVHLGMSGRLLYVERSSERRSAKHDHVVVSLDGDGALVFNDPRRFGLMMIDDPASSELLARVGPETQGWRVYVKHGKS